MRSIWYRTKLWISKPKRLDLNKSPVTYGHMHVKWGKIFKPLETHFLFTWNKNEHKHRSSYHPVKMLSQCPCFVDNLDLESSDSILIGYFVLSPHLIISLTPDLSSPILISILLDPMLNTPYLNQYLNLSIIFYLLLIDLSRKI